MTASKRAALVAVAFSVALAARGARADSSTADQTLAQSLFDDAVKLMEQGHFAEACPKLAESQRLDPGGGTLLNLGFCRENEGKLASAWAAYDEALSQAIKDGRKDRQETAQVHVAELEGKVAKLSIDPSDAAKRIAGLQIRLDDAPVRQAAWNVLTPIDRGEHSIVVTAPGKREYRTEVNVAKDGTVQHVSIPALADAPVAIVVHERGGTEGRRSTSQALIGWVTGGVGVALLGVGAATGALALDAHSKSNADNNGLCGADPHQCTSAGVAYEDQAKTYAWFADFGLGLGLAAVIAGAVLVVSAPHASASVTPVVGAHSGGAAFTMTF